MFGCSSSCVAHPNQTSLMKRRDRAAWSGAPEAADKVRGRGDRPQPACCCSAGRQLGDHTETEGHGKEQT